MVNCRINKYFISFCTVKYKTQYFDDFKTSNQYNFEQVDRLMEPNQCATKTTCGECIRTKSCSWCMKPDNFSHSRCDTMFNLQEHDCPHQYLYSPTPAFYLIEDEELSNKTDADMDPIQLKPQRVSLRVRPQMAKTFQVYFKQALDYPVDLYYLMDLSKSMEDDKAKLAELGHVLAQTMKGLTNNFRLGFGSFVDKTVMPYVSIVPEK